MRTHLKCQPNPTGPSCTYQLKSKELQMLQSRPRHGKLWNDMVKRQLSSHSRMTDFMTNCKNLSKSISSLISITKTITKGLSVHIHHDKEQNKMEKVLWNHQNPNILQWLQLSLKSIIHGAWTPWTYSKPRKSQPRFKSKCLKHVIIQCLWRCWLNHKDDLNRQVSLFKLPLFRFMPFPI